MQYKLLALLLASLCCTYYSTSSDAVHVTCHQITWVSLTSCILWFQLDNQNSWRKIRRTKHKSLLNSYPPTQIPQTETRNRCEMLTEDSSHPEASEKPHPPHSSKPPPIFLHGVINYTEMIKSLTDVAEEEQFLTKCLTNNVIKLACSTSETNRAIIKHCKEQDIYYHTYQLKEDKAFRVVINLLNPNDIYICRTAPLTSRRYILHIYSTNIHIEYFKHAA